MAVVVVFVVVKEWRVRLRCCFDFALPNLTSGEFASTSRAGSRDRVLSRTALIASLKRNIARAWYLQLYFLANEGLRTTVEFQ